MVSGGGGGSVSSHSPPHALGSTLAPAPALHAHVLAQAPGADVHWVTSHSARSRGSGLRFQLTWMGDGLIPHCDLLAHPQLFPPCPVPSEGGTGRVCSTGSESKFLNYQSQPLEALSFIHTQAGPHGLTREGIRDGAISCS